MNLATISYRLLLIISLAMTTAIQQLHAVTVPADATKGQTGDWLYYVQGGTKTLYQYTGTSTNPVVPAGYELAEELFIGNSSLTSITFSPGLKRIPRACMERCTALTSVSLPNTLLEIDDYALFGCTSLTAITLPSGLQRLGSHALQFCSALTDVNIPSGITRLEEFCLSRTALTSVTIPANVTRIEGGAFLWCQSLQTIDIPEQVTYIGPFAFKDCSRLQQIEIPAGVDSIALHTFNNCSSLKTVKLHEGLRSIGDFAFYYAAVQDISLPNTLQRIGKYGLAYCHFAHLTLPASLTQLESGALCNCSSLCEIAIPEGITQLSEKVLCDCSSLKDITLPQTLHRIGKMALYNVPLRHINWPENLTIGYQAFGARETHDSRTRVIPQSTVAVDAMLFYGMNAKSNYYCYSPKLLPANVFESQNLENSRLYVRPELVQLYRTSELGQRFEAIMPLGDTNGDGVLSIADIADEVCFINQNSDASLQNTTLDSRDINGDGAIDHQDLKAQQQAILTPMSLEEAPTLPSIANLEHFVFNTEPLDDCLLLQTSGRFSTEAETALDLLNQIRWEACLEGVWSSGYKHLSMRNFHPCAWSADMERIARIRAVEASFTHHHQRLNGKSISSAKSNGLSTGGENLCINTSFLIQLVSYYHEKDYWMRKDFSETTTHYTTMIAHDNTHVGMANFLRKGTLGAIGSMEFHYDIRNGNTEPLPEACSQDVLIEVKSSYIDNHQWRCKYNNKTVTSDFAIKVGETIDMEYAPRITFTYYTGSKKSYFVTDPNITYTSSAPDVATIDPTTGHLSALKPGITTVTATSEGNYSAEVSVTILGL